MHSNATFNFGPKDAAGERIFAEEAFVVEVQVAIHGLMKRLGVSQKELAKRLSLSEARVSQIFADECNITVRTLARIYHALGATPQITAGPIPEEHRCAEWHRMQKISSMTFAYDEFLVPDATAELSPAELTGFARVLEEEQTLYSTPDVAHCNSPTEKAA